MKAAIDALYGAQKDAVNRHNSVTVYVNYRIKQLLEAQTKLIQHQDMFNSRAELLRNELEQQCAIEREMAEIEAAIVKLESD